MSNSFLNRGRNQMAKSSTGNFLNRVILGAALVAVASFVYLQLAEKPIPLGEVSHHENTARDSAEHQAAKMSPTTLAKDNPKRAVPAQTGSEQVPNVIPLNAQELIAEYRVWTDDQIDAEIALLEDEVDFGRYLERANEGQLDPDEMQKFSDLLITIDSLRHVRNERQIAELEALVHSPPVPTNSENP